VEAIERQRTELTKTDSFSFAVMGCMHFGASDPEDYKLAVKKIKEHHPDFVLFLGSMVDTIGEKPSKHEPKYSTLEACKKDTKLSPAAIESLWKEFDCITATLEIPVYDIPSERSIPANNVVTAEKYFLQRYKRRYYSFEYKNNLFICLDSESHNRADQKQRGFFDGDQLDFLKSSVAQTSKYDNVFIATHRSAWVPGFELDSRWLDIVHPIINKKVRHVFGACLHTLNLRRKDEVTYITSGAAPHWPNAVLKPSFFHFLMVNVSKKQVSIEVVPIKPIAIENLGFQNKTTNLTKTKPAGILTSIAKIAAKKLNKLSLKNTKEQNRLKYLQRLALPEREELLRPEQVIKALKVKSGMNILDIGSGAGTFTFPLARSLSGTGKVFAADAIPQMVDYIREKAAEQGYRNISSILVSPRGVDPFYKQHSFDIIFLCNTYELILRPREYFRELRPSLEREQGRLHILYFRYDSDFGEFEFGDFKKVIEILTAKGEDFPVFLKLSNGVQDFVRNWQKQDIPDIIQRDIVRDFNTMLYDRLFFSDLADYYANMDDGYTLVFHQFLYPPDYRLAKWLLARLNENGLSEAKHHELSDIDKKRLRMLNRMSIRGIFESQVLYDIFKVAVPVYTGTDKVVSDVESAGYEFIHKHDFLEYYDLLEFKRAD